MFFRNVAASGLVPQIAAVMGPVSGAAVYSPALTDLVVMVKGSSQLYLGDRLTVTRAGGSLEDLGGARALSESSGVAHVATDDEAACLEAVRRLLSYLPQNNLEDAPLSGGSDPVDRMDQELESLAAEEAGEARDAHDLLGRVLDGGEVLELMPGWARNLVVGFARLGGRAVGVVANQPAHLGGRLDADACAKGARFVRLCDAFNLPLLTFVDTPGFVGGDEQGRGRIVREAAKLMYAFCEATVPKLTVVTHRALAEGYEVMCPKQVQADFNFAWPAARIGGAESPGAEKGEAAGSPYDAAAAGCLDDVIEPVTTRPRLVAALEACASKRESRPPKKHGNIPL
jgi:acetyl-CoA carboxylase carboxyltransferase component